MQNFAGTSRRRLLIAGAANALLCAALGAMADTALAQDFTLKQVKGFRVWSPIGPPSLLRITHWQPDPANGGTFDFEIISADIAARDEGYLVQAKPIGGGIAEGVMHTHFPPNPGGPAVTYRIQVLAANVAGGPKGWNAAGDIRWNFTQDSDKESDWFYGRNMNRNDVADL